MKTHLNWIRLAALAAVSVLPGMACTYSASANAPTLAPSGGYVSVTVYTQPGCRWSITKNAAWMSSSQNYGVGSGTIYVYAAATRSARSGIVRVYSDYISNELGLTDGSIGGRSSVTGALLRSILQFYVTEN